MREDVIFDVLENDFDSLLACLRVRLEQLLQCVSVLVVLDGSPLPQRAETNNLRKSGASQAADQLKALLAEEEIDLERQKKLSRKSFQRTLALNASLIDFISPTPVPREIHKIDQRWHILCGQSLTRWIRHLTNHIGNRKEGQMTVESKRKKETKTTKKKKKKQKILECLSFS